MHDVCSAIQPLGANSPFFRSLDLDVEWVQPDAQAAHPLDDGTAVLLERDLEATAAGLGEDGDAYRALVGPLAEHWSMVEPVLIGPLPPCSARSLARLALELGPWTGLHALAAARSLAEDHVRDRAGARTSSPAPPRTRCFRSSGGRAPASVSHCSSSGTSSAGASRRGGAQRLADALVARLGEHGVRVHP